MNKIDLLSISVTTGSYNDIVNDILCIAQNKSSSYTCVANVHMLVEASRDKGFAKIINEADIVTPDGKPLTWAMKLLHGKQQARVAGMDLLPDLLIEAEKLQLPVYFLGGTEAMLQRAQSYLQVKHPNLVTAGMLSLPFRTITHEEQQQLIAGINNSGAKLLFVCLGCPKQEKWMASMKGRINAAMIGVGGALPVVIGIQKRAPKWMQKYGFEWAYRLRQEPRRLFKRYAVTNSYFIFVLVKNYVTSKIFSKSKHSQS